jgi:hypothetical protein
MDFPDQFHPRAQIDQDIARHQRSAVRFVAKQNLTGPRGNRPADSKAPRGAEPSRHRPD